MTKYVIIKDIFAIRPELGNDEEDYFIDKENELFNLKYLESDEMTLVELYEYAIEDHLGDLREIKEFIHSGETIMKVRYSVECPSFLCNWGVHMWFANYVIIKKVNAE
jgi:hypothetical protein